MERMTRRPGRTGPLGGFVVDADTFREYVLTWTVARLGVRARDARRRKAWRQWAEAVADSRRVERMDTLELYALAGRLGFRRR